MSPQHRRAHPRPPGAAHRKAHARRLPSRGGLARQRCQEGQRPAPPPPQWQQPTRGASACPVGAATSRATTPPPPPLGRAPLARPPPPRTSPPGGGPWEGSSADEEPQRVEGRPWPKPPREARSGQGKPRSGKGVAQGRREGGRAGAWPPL